MGGWSRSSTAMMIVKRGSASLGLAGFLFACGEEPPPPEPVVRPVRTVEVLSVGGGRTRSFAGVAEAAVESNLSFRVSGNIQRLLVVTGDRVEAGQLIAELDATDFELQVQEAQAALLQAEAQARQAEADYERVRGLYENRNASRSDLDRARAGAESARAQIDASRQRLEQARSRLSYTRLRAPASGSIAAVPAEVNENVLAGARIAVLTSGSRPEVKVAVPESLIGQLRRGDEVSIAFDAFPGRQFAGVIQEVGVMATGLATTFPVTLRLSEETEDVRSGMAATVEFTFGGADERSRFLLPPHAVLEDREGRFVFIVEPQGGGRGTVRRKEVTVGELTGEGLEVFEGIADGDRVVTAGVSQIHDGLTVRLEVDDAS